MNIQPKSVLTIVAACSILALAFRAQAAPEHSRNPLAGAQDGMGSKGSAVAYPWLFDGGTDTARTTAMTTVEEILRKADYSPVSSETATSDWMSSHTAAPRYGHMPTRARIRAYGKSVGAKVVLYGMISWHTRIWVNVGPKTISTATVDAYVLNVASGKVVYHKTAVEGRSDEPENAYKIAADVLVTPIVSAVSGGPATPQEQKAVQIALALALHDWAIPTSDRN